MVDHEIQEQSKEHRITTVEQMRKSVSNSGCNRKSANLPEMGLKLRAQNLSQYTAENYSFLTQLGGRGGTLLMRIGVIN